MTIKLGKSNSGSEDTKNIRQSNVREVAQKYTQQVQEHGQQVGQSTDYLMDRDELAERLQQIDEVESIEELVERFQSDATEDTFLQKNVFGPLKDEIESSTSLRPNEVKAAIQMLYQQFWSHFWVGLEKRDIQFEEVAKDVYSS